MSAVPRIEGRSGTGVWGAVGGALTFGVVVAYSCYAHLYLAVSNEPWPPETTPALPVLGPAAHVALVGLVAVLAVRAGRPLATGADQLPRAAALGVVAGLGAVALAAGVLLVDGLGLELVEHAHDASALTLHALVGAAAAASVLVTGLVAYQAARLGDHPWVEAAVAVAGVCWVAVALAWAAVAAVVYGWPVLT